MADIESNIDINIDASNALAAIKQLQAQVSAFHQAMSKSGAEAAAKSAQMQNKLVDSINATGKWSSSIKTVQTSTESFTTALEKNKFSLGQYFKFGASQVAGFRKIFSTEFDTIDKVARERVKTLQTQYIKLGRDANGAMRSISVRPLELDMNNLGTQVAMTSQKQQIFNEVLKQGSTNLLNFGKNTQWAGRQLMVGFTIPLSIFGAAAAREFMKIEEQTIRLQRVYGDFGTSAESTDKMTESIKGLATEFTKYGIAVEKTIGLAADAAAMGKTGADLTAQVAEASRLAVLGGVEQAAALETTTSLTNAFGVATDKLAGKVNFLNAVENQTVTSIEDLTEAIPKAGPVVQQLGGDVEDLAFFLTAMKEGGINASEGANALKSGLASIINPGQNAVDMLNSFGINIKGIVDANKGDIKGTVVGLAESLNQLDPLNRAQAIETLFGKFQFARISTLFQNITSESSQANKVLQLTMASTEELAVLSEREMKKIEDSPMYKFQGAVEKFQAALAPIGETFVTAVTPIIEFGTDLLNKFNDMGDGAKQFWVMVTAAVAGLGPVLLMTFGLMANGVANIVKLFAMLGNGLTALSGGSKILGGDTSYMTQAQLEAAAVAASLNQIHQDLIQTITSETTVVMQLANAYQAAATAASGITARMNPAAGGGPKPKKYAKGVYSVPGPKGAGDVVPAMLSPGEAVIPSDKADKYSGLIEGIIAGNIPGYKDGLTGYTNATALLSGATNSQLNSGNAPRANVLSELNLGGQAIFAPILSEIAKKLGATGQAQIRQMVQENPEFAQFATQLSNGLIAGVAEGVGDVSDPEMYALTQDVVKKSAAGQSDAFSKAAEEVFTEITTIDDSTIKRINADGTKMRTTGRTAFVEGVSSYKGSLESARALAENSGLSGQIPQDAVLAHLADTRTGSPLDLAGGRPLSDMGKRIQANVESGTDTVYRSGVDQRVQVPAGTGLAEARDAIAAAVAEQLATEIETSGEMASPSERMKRDGENLVAGLEEGILSGGQSVAAAGKKLGGVSNDPEIAARIKAEAKAQEDAALKAQGLSGGMVNLPTPQVKKKVTKAPKGAPVDANGNMLRPGVKDPVLAALDEQAREFDNNSPIAKASQRFVEAIDNAAQKFPLLAGMVDTLKNKLGEHIIGEDQMIDANGMVVPKLQEHAAATDQLTDAQNNNTQAQNADANATSGVDQGTQDVAIDKEAKRQKRAKLAGKVMGAGFVASTALGMMSMAGGPMAETAQGLMPLAGAASTLLPMLISMGPVIGSIVGALALLAGGAIAFNNMLNDGREKGIKFAESMGVGTKAMDAFAEFAGKATSRQIGDKIREKKTSAFAFQSNEKTFGQSYVESEAGKSRIDSLKEILKTFSGEDVGKRLGMQLGTAVADNLMSAEQARSIAVNLGEQIGDQSFLSNAVVTINQLVGPNGENVMDNGIDLKVNLLAKQRDSFADSEKFITKQAERRLKEREAVSARFAEQSSKGDILAKTGTAIDALGKDFGNLFAPLQDAATSSAMLASNIGQSVELTQQLVDATDIYWNKLIDAAIAQGDLSKASELELTRLGEKQRLLDEQKQTYLEIESIVNKDYGFDFLGMQQRIDRDQRWETQRKSIETKYGATGVAAANAIKDQGNEQATTGITEVRQVQLLAALDAGTLDPAVATDIVNIYANDEPIMEKVMSIITEMDPESANQVLALTKAFEDDTQKKTFITRFEGATLEEQEKYLEAYTFINKIAEAGDKELAFIMEFYNADENIALLEEVQRDLKVIEETPDQQVNLTMLGNVVGVPPEQLAGYAGWFEGLPTEQKRAFTTIFTSIYNQVGNRDENVDYQNYLKENGNMADSDAAFAAYAGDTAKALTPTLTDITSAAAEVDTAPVETGGGGGGGRTGSVLDDLLQKLRRLQIATIDLTEGWAGAREALDALFPGGASNSPFQGIEQQMRRLGAKEDLISLIAGMDPEEFQKRKEELFTFDGAGNIAGFRDSLLSIGAAFRSINLGNFQNEQQKSMATINDQNTAIRKLIANGYSMADAYEMVQDAAFASAVAQEGNNDIIRQATAEYEAATKQAKLFAAAQAAATANSSASDRAATVGFINANSGNLSNAVIEEMLNNQEFATLLMSPNLSQEQKDALQEWINNIENSAQINLEANLTNINGMEQVFDEGFSKAMEAFSAQEKKIELEFAVKKDPFQNTITNAQNLIADIQNRPGGMDDLQADLERIAEQETDINEKYKKRTDALDQIKKQNDRIIQQRKAELTVADAITQGDIAAAAKAIEDARAQQAQNNMQAQSEMMQRQKEAEFAALTGQMGMTREQIEARIRDLKVEIFNIEESMLEPAQYQLSLLERQEQRQKSSLTVLGMTRREWETIKNRIDLAKTSSTEYKAAMEAARDVVGKIVEYWTEIQKPKTTVHTIVTVYETQGSAGGGNIGASGEGGSGSGSNNTPAADPYPAETYGMLTAAAIRSRYASFRGAPISKVGPTPKVNAYSMWQQWLKAEEKSPGGNASKTYAANLGKYMKTFGYNTGGLVSGMGDTDTIRAMLTPGEFIITKPAVNAYGAAMMKDINNGTFDSGSVYNYSINVKVDTDADANQIANAVIAKIKGIDSKRIQGNRF